MTRATTVVMWAALLASSCSVVGPSALRQSRLRYNETVKQTSEEEMLLNIVRLRYADTPSSLAVSSIAAQFELAASAGVSPFFVAGAVEPFGTALPQASVSMADRPTFSLTPLDDSDFARRLFTPLSLEGAIYLARTTWPIETVFRLYLENLNWVPNAQTASGPTPAEAPPSSDFLEGIRALQQLQQRGDIVFGSEERVENLGGPVPASSVTAETILKAAEQNLEMFPQPDGKTWLVQKRSHHFVLHVNPAAFELPATRAFLRVFHLKPGATHYDVTVDDLKPFVAAEPLGQLDLETRSMLQALYFVSHGVQVPQEHLEKGLARTTLAPDGKPWDWEPTLRGLFRMESQSGDCGGVEAHLSVEYSEHCFFIPEADHDSKSTFALLMELARLEVPSGKAKEPILTIPLGR